MKVAPVSGRWGAALTLAALSAALAAPSAQAAASTERSQAVTTALSALDAKKGDDALVVFALRSTVPAGTSITQAGPESSVAASGAAATSTVSARLARAGVKAFTAGPVLKASEPSWVLYADNGPSQAYEHPGRVVLVGARTGKVTLSERLRWVPLVDGKLPAFFRTAAAYRGKRFRVFDRPWKQKVTAKAAQAPAATSTPPTDAQKRLADALSNERSCALRVSDTLGDFYDFGRVDKTRASLGRALTKLVKLNSGFVSERYVPSSGRTPIEAAQRLISRGCSDLFLYVAGSGTKSGTAGLVVGVRPTGGGIQWHTISAAALEALVHDNRNVTFKFVFDAPYAGRVAETLKDERNVTVLLTPGGAGDPSFTYLPEILGGQGVIANTTNPLGLLEFTNNLVVGLERFAASADEIDHAIAERALGRSGSVMAWMLARAFDLGPSPFTSQLLGTSGQRVPVTSAAASRIRPPVNHAPLPLTPPQFTREDVPENITLLAVDSDLDPLTFTVLTPPTHGTLSGTAPFLRYTPDRDFHGFDSLTFRVSDGRGGVADQTVVITVISDNDAPAVVSGPSSTPPTFTENGAAVVVDNALTVTDPDSPQLVGAKAEIVTGRVTGDVLAATPAAGITASYDASTGVLTLLGNASRAAYQSTLRSVTFGSTSDDPGTTRTIRFTADDGDELGLPANRDVTVTPVNDAPVNTVPPNQTVDEDTTLVLSGASKVAVADVDARTDAIETTISTANGGKLIPATTTAPGLTVTGSNTTTLKLTGPQASIATALASLSYVPATNFNGVDTVTVATSDLGRNGTGGTKTDSDTFTVTVGPQNDAPVNTVPGARSVAEDDHTDFAGNAFSVADADAGSDDVEARLQVEHGTITVAAGGTLVGNATGDVEVTGTLTQVNASLATVRYAPSADYTGADTLTLTTSDLGHNPAPAKTDVDTVALTVTAVNDAPVLTSPASTVNVIEDTPKTFSAGGPTELSVADVDAGTGDVEVTLTAAAGTLSAGLTLPGLTVVGDGTAQLKLTGTLVEVDDALDGLTYTPVPDASGPTTIAISVSDLGNTGAGGAQSDAATVNLTIAAVNDAPVLAPATGAIAYTEGAAATAVAGDLTASDVDDLELEGATVSITAGRQPGDVLTFVDTASITGTYDSATGVLTLTGTDSVADYQAALRAVTFSTSEDAPTASRTIALTATDGTDTSAAITRTLTITPTNDAPIVTAGGGSAAYVEGAASPVAVAPALTVSDVDDTNLEGATITVTTNRDAATDVLSFTPQSGITVQSWTPATGTLVLTGSASKADYQAALRTVAFAATGDTPSPATRTISFTVTDGDATSAADTRDVTVDDVNDAPVNTVPGAQSVAEDASLTFTGASKLSVADVDAAAGDELEVTVTVTGGTFDLGGTTGLTFTVGDGNDDATATFAGTKADLNAALDGLVYTPTPGTSGARQLQITTDDQGHTGGPAETDTDTVAITVNALNRAPVNNLPAAQTTPEDTAKTFSTGGGNAISITDVDAGSGIIQTAIGVEHGTVTLSQTTGLAFLNGTANGQSAIHVEGTLANINAALDGLSYAPAANFNGADTLTMATEDNGNTGVGGNKTDTDTLGITVTAVNDAPTANAPAAGTVAEEGTLTFSTGNLNALTVGDVDAGAGTLTVELTATHGTTTLGSAASLTVTGNGTAHVTATGTIAALNAGLEGTTFVPAIDYDGSATLTLDVSDNGNTGSGGAKTATDSTSITVTGVNDAPVLTAPTSASVNQNGSRTFSTGNGNAISVADVDAGTDDVQVTLGVAHGTLSTNGTTGLTFTTGDGTDDPALVFTGTLAAVNTALNGLVYEPTAGYDGADQLDVDVSDLGNNGTGGPLTDAADVALTINAANSAPVNTVPGAQTLNEDTTKTFSGADKLAVSDDDVDPATGELEVDLDVDHGLLNLDGTAGLTFSAGDGVSDATMTFKGSPDAINAALDGLTYTPAPNYAGADTLTIVTDDLGEAGPPGPLTDTDTVALTITAQNDAPVLIRPASITADEDVTQAIAGVSLADVDAAGDDLRLRLAVTNGTLTLGTVTGLSFTTGDGANDAEIVAEGTVGELNAALATLSYTGASNFNGSDTLDLDLSDLGHTGAGGTLTDAEDVPITVTAVNDAPVNTKPGAQTIDEDTTLTLSGGNAISVADVDAASLRVTVQATQGTLSLSGTAGLSFTTGDGITDTTMTFTGTKAAINTALDGLTFTPGANYNGAAGIGITTNDEGATGSGGALQDQDTVAITVTPVNDAPVLTQPDGTALSYTEDVPSENHEVAVAPNLTVADIDNASIASATVTLATHASGDELLFTNQNGISSAGYNAGTGTLTLTGSSSLANYQTALRSVRYRTTSENPDTTQRTITFRVNDGQSANNLSNQVTRALDVVRTNDAPVADDEAFSGADRVIGNTSLVVDDPSDVTTLDPAGPEKKIVGDILDGDTDPDSATLTVTPQTDAATTNGGKITLEADGDFTYLPPQGCGTSDTFSYTVTDNHPTDAKTDTGTLTFTIADCVWYVDAAAASQPAAATGGTSQQPFKTLADLDGASGAGDEDGASDKIFVYGTTTYAGPLPLEASQQVLTQSHGLTVPDGGSGTVTLVPASGSNPTISGVVASTNNTIQGLTFGASSGYSLAGTSVGTLTVNTVTGGGLFNAVGGAVNIDGTGNTLDVNLSSLTAAGGSNANGISLTNASGTFTAGSGTLSGGSGTEVALTNSPLNFTLGAAVNNTAGALVSITGSTGGTKDFNGKLTSSAAGIGLTNNTGATIRFDGGLALTTTTNAAFAATGGGTVAVTDPAGADNNVITTTTGTALEVSNTTIHGDDVTFERISSNGAPRGILLNHTGSSGNLAVTSSGTGTCDETGTTGCTGGAIVGGTGGDDSSSTPVGTGIVLNDTRDVALTRMRVANHSNYAIRGTSVVGFSLQRSVIDGVNGTNDADPFDDGSIKFNELTGSALLDLVQVSGGYQDNVSVENSTGTLNRFTMTNSNIGPNSTTGGNDGLFLESLAGSPAVINATITGNAFVGSRGDQAQVTLEGNSGGDLVFTGNDLAYDPGQTTLGGGAALIGGRAGATTMNVSNNGVLGATTTAIKMLKSQGTGTMAATVQSNTIGSGSVANSGSLQGSGFSVDQRGGGRLDLNVLNNAIRQYNNNGIELVAGAGAGAQSGQLNAKVEGNTLTNPGANPAFPLQSPGFHVNSGTLVGDSFATCIDLGPNSFTGSARNGGPQDFRLRQRMNTTIKLINPSGGYIGAPGDTTAIANFVRSEIGNNPSGAAVVDYPVSGGGFVGGTSCP